MVIFRLETYAEVVDTTWEVEQFINKKKRVQTSSSN